MDPNGGNNPSAPKLDNTQQPVPEPNQQPTDIYSQPQSFDQTMGTGASIPPEMPASGPEMQDLPPTPQPAPTDVPMDQDGFPSPQAPQYQDPSTAYQQPAPDPMYDQSMMDGQMAAPAGGGKNKVIMMAGGAVVALLLLGGSAFAGYSMGKTAGRQQAAAEFQAQQAAAQESSLEDATASEDVTLDLSLTTPKYDENEDQQGSLGEQVNTGDGFALYVTNIQRKFDPNDNTYELDETKELVKVNFVIGNFAEDKAMDIDSSAFYIEEGDGTKVTPESRLTDYEGSFDTVNIQPGSQVTGSIVFAVTQDITPLVFVREQVYRVNQDREYTKKISIDLAG